MKSLTPNNESRMHIYIYMYIYIHSILILKHYLYVYIYTHAYIHTMHVCIPLRHHRVYTGKVLAYTQETNSNIAHIKPKKKAETKEEFIKQQNESKLQLAALQMDLQKLEVSRVESVVLTRFEFICV
jgi:hypothetical protein